MITRTVGLLRTTLKYTIGDQRSAELRSRVEKSAGADLLRDIIGFAAEKLIALEVGAATSLVLIIGSYPMIRMSHSAAQSLLGRDRQMRRAATHDFLTGVPNRFAFNLQFVA